MDTLTLRTKHEGGRLYIVQWQWRQQGARLPLGGEIKVSVDEVHQNDVAALAELRAIMHLLEVRQIHGTNRMGAGVGIEVSASSIRKALLRGALKASGAGKTDKGHIAAAGEFLATKYFEAAISVCSRWRDSEYRAFETQEMVLEMGPTFPRIKVDCPLLGGPVAVTRHAMYRYIGRIDQGLSRWDENDLSNVPDARFTAAWVWMQRVFANPNLEEVAVRPAQLASIQARYGKATRYVRFPDSLIPAVLVVTQDQTGLAVVTVLREDQAGFIDKPDYVVGQRIVKGHVHERIKSLR